MNQEEFDSWRAGMSDELRTLTDQVEARLKDIDESGSLPPEIFRIMVVNTTMREWIKW